MISEIVLEKVEKMLIFISFLFKMINKYSKYERRVGHAIVLPFFLASR